MKVTKEMNQEKCYANLHPKGQVDYKDVIVSEGEDEVIVKFGWLFGLTLYIPREDIHHLADALSDFRTKPKDAETTKEPEQTVSEAESTYKGSGLKKVHLSDFLNTK
jgi:hypothetical protein